MIEIWVSTPAFTCRVGVDEKSWTVVSTCPILRWGIGKPWKVVLGWCYKKWGDEVRTEDLNGRKL